MAKDITLFFQKDSLYFKKVHTKLNLSELGKYDGILIDSFGNEKETRKIIDSLKGKKKKIAVQSFNNSFNRRVLETMKVNFLANVENSNNKSTLKQRDSGINMVIAKIAKKKGITFLIDFNEIKKKNQIERVEIISKIIQNIKICRKARCKIAIVSFGKNNSETLTEKQKESFLYSLGASSSQVKESLNL